VTSARLPTGGALDRGRPLAFTFDGKPHVGFAGDSIASALLANGVSIVGRSFKYHRPRGIWGAWTEEPNAIVDVTRNGATTPNLRATTEALENDVAVRSVNATPTAAADRAALLDRLAPVLPAGFYYKTFLWPRWETFEGSIRAMAGLGRVDPGNRPPADNPQFNARCDLLVVGAGPAGLAAAAAAARANRTVFLIDDHAEIGGQLVHRGGAIEGGDWRDWAQGVVRGVEAAGGRVMTRTTAYGVYDGNLVCAWERRAPAPDALWRIRPQKIVIAAGAIERPLIVPDNDRPGVMSADAALVYLKRFGVLVGKQLVVATNNDSAYAVPRSLGRGRRGGRDCRHARFGVACTLRVTHSAAIEGVIGSRSVEAVPIGADTTATLCFCPAGGRRRCIFTRRRAGRLRYDEDRVALVPRVGSKPRRRRAPPTAPSPRGGIARGARGQAAARPRAERACGPLRCPSLLAEGRRRRAALDRFPERCDAEGRRARRA
jgi:sarcosine oxidase subunit alpha